MAHVDSFLFLPSWVSFSAGDHWSLDSDPEHLTNANNKEYAHLLSFSLWTHRASVQFHPNPLEVVGDFFSLSAWGEMKLANHSLQIPDFCIQIEETVYQITTVQKFPTVRYRRIVILRNRSRNNTSFTDSPCICFRRRTLIHDGLDRRNLCRLCLPALWINPPREGFKESKKKESFKTRPHSPSPDRPPPRCTRVSYLLGRISLQSEQIYLFTCDPLAHCILLHQTLNRFENGLSYEVRCVAWQLASQSIEILESNRGVYYVRFVFYFRSFHKLTPPKSLLDEESSYMDNIHMDLERTWPFFQGEIPEEMWAASPYFSALPDLKHIAEKQGR